MSEIYTDDEVQEILRRALQRDEGLRHAELTAAAAEVGIDAEAVDRAASEVRRGRSRGDAIARRKRRRAKRLMRSGAVYAAVAVFLYFINLFAGGATWFQFPALSLALVFVLQCVRHWTADDEDAVIKEEERRAKRLRKQNRKERRKAQALRRRSRSRSRSPEGASLTQSAEEAFEAAVQRGLARLLQSAASGLDRLVTPAEAQSPKTDLDRYVAKHEGRSGGATRTTNTSPSVRVESADPTEQELREAMEELEAELDRPAPSRSREVD